MKRQNPTMTNANYRSDTFDTMLHTVLLEITIGCFEVIELRTLKKSK